MQLTSAVHWGWDGASGGVLSETIRPFTDDPIQCVSHAKVKKWVRSHISDQTISSSKHTGVSIGEAIVMSVTEQVTLRVFYQVTQRLCISIVLFDR